MTTDYNKTDVLSPTTRKLTQFTEDTESTFAQTTIPTTNIIFININKHNIPNGKMHSTCRYLPDHIVCKITQGNNIRRANTCDPVLKLLNEEINFRHTKTQTKPMEGILRCTLGSQDQHAHSLEDDTRSIQQSTSTHTNHIHNIQQQNSNHTQTLRIVSPNNSRTLLNTQHTR